MLKIILSILAQDLSEPLNLPSRWWSAREFAWRVCEGVGLRFSIVDGISGRVRTTEGQVAARDHLLELEKQTGIRGEVMGGILVFHRPRNRDREGLQGALGSAEAWRLGCLKDARAWPSLAVAVSGKDVNLALSAAQALRRLDGEEDFGLKRWLVSSFTMHGKTPPADGFWQVPLGLGFAEPVSKDRLAVLAVSPWIPLREAAARLAPGFGEAGRTLAEKLTNDPSPLVRQAAQRSLRAWETPAASPKLVPPNGKDHWTSFAKGESGARAEAPWLSTFGSDLDLRKLIEVADTERDANITIPVLSALAANAGGPVAKDFFRRIAAEGKPWPNVNHSDKTRLQFGKVGLAMLMDGEDLTRELGPLLGTENWSLSSEFLLARFGGPTALPYLGKGLVKRPHPSALAMGYLGGPDVLLPLQSALESDDLDAATAAARALGDSTLLSAVPLLVRALGNPNRVVRNRAALALGRIGGPDSIRALSDLVLKERDYLVLRAAAQMLRELARIETPLPEPSAAYDPLNPRLGSDLPCGRWVPLGRIYTVASVGETRLDVDPYSGLLVRYGGCSGCYSNECIGLDTASGKWFVIRVPENLGLFYNETRASQGCSRGLAFDPKSRCFWINHAVGGNGVPSNPFAYPSRFACKYDPALDRFEGNFPDTPSRSGEGPTHYVSDPIRGRIYTEVLGPTSAVLDTATARLVEARFEGAPSLPHIYNHDPMAFDPVRGILMRSLSAGNHYKNRPDLFGLWLFDPVRGVCRKSRSPLPAVATSKMWMGYDALNREILFFSPAGAFRYDRENDAWDRVADGDCGTYITLGFDVRHNIFLGIRGGDGLAAFRYKGVPQGTQAFFGQ